MSYHLENNRSNTALLFPHLSNLAGFSLHHSQKEIEHCSLKKGAIGSLCRPWPRLQYRTCSVGRVVGFFPRLLIALPQVTWLYGSLGSTALRLLGHKELHLCQGIALFLKVRNQLTAQFCSKGVPKLRLLRKSYQLLQWQKQVPYWAADTPFPAFYWVSLPIPYNQHFIQTYPYPLTLCCCPIIQCLLLDLLSLYNTPEILVHPYNTCHQLQCSFVLDVSIPSPWRKSKVPLVDWGLAKQRGSLGMLLICSGDLTISLPKGQKKYAQ